MKSISLSNKNISVKSIIFISLLIFMWILYAFNLGNSDFNNYYSIYGYLHIHNMYPEIEPGLSLMFRLCNLIGLNYYQFLAVFSAVGLILIASTINKYAYNPNVVLILYFIFPYILDVIQIRNFIAMAIFIYATKYLINMTRKNIIKYVLCILLAASFHLIAIFYLIFILVALDMKKIKIITFLITFFFTVIVVVPGIISSVLALFNKNSSYASGGLAGTQLYTKIFFIPYFLIVIFFVNYSFSAYMKKNKDNTNRNINYYNVIVKISIISCAFYPFVLLSVNFFRLFRNTFLLYFILFSFISTKRGKINLKNILVNLTILAFIIVSNYAFISKFNAKDIVYPIFFNNSFFNFFGSLV